MGLSEQQKLLWNRFLYDYYYSNHEDAKKWDIENDIYSALSNNKERIIIDYQAIDNFDENNHTKLSFVLTSVNMEENIKELEEELNFEDEVNIEDPTKEYRYSLKKWNHPIPKEETDPKQFPNKKLKLGFKNIPLELSIVDTTKEQVWGKLIMVRGIIQNVGIPYTYIKQKKFECEKCAFSFTENFSIIQKKYRINTDIFCPYCHANRRFKESSEKTERVQLLVISEKTSAGMPYTLKCIIPEDLIDSSEPDERRLLAGSEIILIGVVEGLNLPNFLVKVPILNVLHWQLENEELKITNEDIQQINEWSTKENLVDSMAQSFCPSIYGYEKVKEALILSCVGGVHKYNKKDKKLKRGSLHILMIGDPSCLTKNHYITLSDGTMRKISSMGRTHLQSINFNILADKNKIDKTIRFHKFENQKIYEVITNSGKSIKGTYNHPLMTKNGWKRIDELKIGDELKTLTKINCKKKDLVKLNWNFDISSDGIDHCKTRREDFIIPKYFNEDLAKLLGFLLDGHFRKYNLDFYIQENEFDKIKIIEDLIKNTFNFNHIKIKEKSGKWINNYKYKIISIYSKDISRWIGFLINKKEVPELVFQSRNSVVSSYLSSVFDSDGCIFEYFDKKQKVKKYGLSLRSKSIDLLRGIQLLLLRFDIFSNIEKWKTKNKITKLEGNITYKLWIRKVEDIKKFYSEIGFICRRKKRKIKEVYNEIKNKKTQKKSEWEKIKSISECRIEDVYDIEVPKTHSFVANGVVSHNSGKSTLSMFIYNYLKKSQYAVCSEMSLDYDEPIMIYEGGQIKTKKIGEFVENYNEKNNTQVLSINPLNFKCEWKNIKNVLKHKDNRPLLRISLETGRNVTITKDHSIYVADKEGIHTKKGNELKEGDFVVIPKRIPLPDLHYPKEINLVKELLKLPKDLIKEIYLHNIPKNEILKLGKTKHKNYYHIERECIPLIEVEGLSEDIIRKATLSTKHIPTFIPIDERLMKFLGYYVAEGYYVEAERQQYSTVFCFGNKDNKLREDVIKITKELFNLECREYFNRKIYPEIAINNKIILYLLKYVLNVKKYASKKEIPEIVFNRPENERFAFLKAYIQGDWGVSASKKLISDLQYLGLMSQKIIGSYIRKPFKTKIRNRTINPQKNHYSLYQRMIYEILKNGIPKTLKKIDNIPTELIQYSLEKTLGLGNCKGRTKLSALKKRIEDNNFNVNESDLQFLNKISSSDLGFVKIRKIENIFQKNNYVYDISVEGNENFIGGFGGILCHNSHAGLGVALIKDPETESWMITSGVLPLAHKSIAILDELDKANPDDIKSLNVVMEMQMLPFSKGGIHARLDSQTTVIGIANPKLSRFDTYTDLKEQVTFDEVLLSRFDLKFAFKDVADEERDKRICERVFESEKVKTPMTSEFLFKYITFCKKFMPTLSKESYEILKDYYLKLRKKTADKSGILQITQRQFDALIRMTEAYAKLRLSNETIRVDSERAIKLFEHYLGSFGFNPETGEIDIDKAEGRTSKQTRDKHYRMLEIMRGLQKFMKTVSRIDFEKACSNEFTLEEIDKWILDMKKQTEVKLIETQPNMFQIID